MLVNANFTTGEVTWMAMSMPRYLGFSDFVRSKNRHILNDKWRDYIERIARSAENRIVTVGFGARLWRALLGHNPEEVWVGGDDGWVEEIKTAYGKERMLPRVDRARENRANPKGIPCLYTATDPQTAMSEVRPWIGSILSLAELRTTRNLRVVKCTEDPLPEGFPQAGEPNDDRNEWKAIDQAFREPITPDDDLADYAPTQLIADVFRDKRYDGLIYSSSVCTGLTVALFDLESVAFVERSLYSTKRVAFEFTRGE